MTQQSPPQESRRGASNKRPAVFFAGATQRVFKQRTISAGLRAASHVARAALTQIVALLTSGLPSVPRISESLRKRSARVILADGTAVDVYQPGAPSRLQDHGTTVVVYVHGGAWGSGEAWNFARVGTCLSESLSTCPVVILDYRNTQYPIGDMTDQATSVVLALRFARREFPSHKVLCMAHSSGAHVSALAMLGRHNAAPVKGTAVLADVFIAQAGVFDVGAHFLYESSRGVAMVSPMVHACCPGGLPDAAKMDAHSPLHHLRERKRLDKPLLAPTSGLGKFRALFLEGFLAGQQLSSIMRETPCDGLVTGTIAFAETEDSAPASRFPITFVQAAIGDLTVPATSSLRFYQALRECGATARLLVYEGEMSHMDFVMDWMVDGVAQRESRCSVLDTHEGEGASRKRVAMHVYGERACSIHTDGLDTPGQAAHIRDVVRIIRAMNAE
jgi:acetyl esterase/lipase